MRRESPFGRLNEERGVIVSFIVKLIVVFALLAVAANDVGQIIWAQVRAANASGQASQAAADAFKSRPDPKLARAAADAAAHDADVTVSITSFQVNPDGSVSVSVRKKAITLVVQRVSFLRGFGLRHSTTTATPSSG